MVACAAVYPLEGIRPQAATQPSPLPGRMLAFAMFRGFIWGMLDSEAEETSLPDGATLPVLDHELADDELQWMKSVYADFSMASRC